MTIGPWCFTRGENQRGLCLLASIEFRCDFAGFSRSSRLAEISEPLWGSAECCQISEPLWGSAECCQMHPVCIGHSDSGMTCVSSGGSLSQAGRSEQLQLSMKSRTRQGKSRQSWDVWNCCTTFLGFWGDEAPRMGYESQPPVQHRTSTGRSNAEAKMEKVKCKPAFWLPRLPFCWARWARRCEEAIVIRIRRGTEPSCKHVHSSMAPASRKTQHNSVLWTHLAQEKELGKTLAASGCA